MKPPTDPKTRQTKTVLAFALTLIVFFGAVFPAVALWQPEDGNINPNPNKPFPQKCGVSVNILIDNSASLSQENLTDMQDASKNLVDVLAGSTAVSSVGVVNFSQGFEEDISEGAMTRAALTELDSSTNISAVKTAIDSINVASAETLTNWEAALLEASATGNDDDADVMNEDRGRPADIVIIISDGNPNAYGYPTLNGTGSNSSLEAATMAANYVKNESSRVIGIGVPDVTNSLPDANPFEQITDGSSSTSNLEANDPQVIDYYLLNDSGDVTGVLQNIGEQFSCSVSLEKRNDANEDSSFGDDETAPSPGEETTYEVTLTNTGEINLSVEDFADDVYAGLSNGDLTCDTSSGGLVGEEIAASDSVTCTFQGSAPNDDNSSKTNTFNVTAVDDGGNTLNAADDTTVRSPDEPPEISVTKVNDASGDGAYSDDETSPNPGDAVTYRVVIENTGNDTVTLDEYWDNKYGAPSLNTTLNGTVLDPGEELNVEFTGSTPSDDATAKTNMFVVNASDNDGGSTSAQDDTTVRSPDLPPEISVTKVNDANGDGMYTDDETSGSPGDTVTYRVVIENVGDDTVTLDEYWDNKYGAPTLNASLNGTVLDPGEELNVEFTGSTPSDDNTAKTNTFVVNASDDDGGSTSAEDDTTVRSPDVLPEISVNKVNDADGDGMYTDDETSASPGDAVTYRVVIENVGDDTVTLDEYWDNKYGAASLNTSLNGTVLNPDETLHVEFIGSTPSDDNTAKTNTFVVNASDDDGGSTSAEDDTTVRSPDLPPEISVNKVNDADGDGAYSDDETSPNPGDAVTYRVVIENTGNDTVTLDEYWDNKYGAPTLNTTLNGTVLEPGEELNVEFTGSTPSDDNTAKTNTFVVNASDDDGGSTSAEDDTTVRSPDLPPEISVNKVNDADGDGAYSDDETSASPGDAVTYRIVIENVGDDTVTLDAYWDNKYGAPTLNASLNGTVLDPGEELNVEFTGSTPSDDATAKTNTFVVNASDDDGGSASAQDDTTVRSPDVPPEISVNKVNDADGDGAYSDDETSASPGDAVTYRVVIENVGDDTVTLDEYWDNKYGAPSLNATLNGTTLAPGEELHVEFTGSTPIDDATAKTNTFVVNASDDDGGSTSAEDDTTVRSPDIVPSISVDKVNDANGDGTFSDDETSPNPGDTVVYRVVVTNSGDDAVSLDGYWDDVYGTPSLNVSLVGETLAPGEELHVEFSGSTPSDDATAKTNTFQVNASDDDGNDVDDSDDTTVRSPDLPPEISVDKSNDANRDGTFTDDETAPSTGANVTYLVVITNTGFDDVTLDDYWDDVYGTPTLNVTLAGSVLAPGDSLYVTFNGTSPSEKNGEKVNTFVVNASDDDGGITSAEDNTTVHSPGMAVCPRTPGFWSTHNEEPTGNNPDLVTDQLPIWLGDAGGAKSVEVDNVDVFSQEIFDYELTEDSHQSNGISKLYVHLLAAKLNQEVGANVPNDVQTAMDEADAFLASHDESDWSSLTQSEQEQVLDWKDTLDEFNNSHPEGCVEDWWKDDDEETQTSDDVGPQVSISHGAAQHGISLR